MCFTEASARAIRSNAEIREAIRDGRVVAMPFRERVALGLEPEPDREVAAILRWPVEAGFVDAAQVTEIDERARNRAAAHAADALTLTLVEDLTPDQRDLYDAIQATKAERAQKRAAQRSRKRKT